MFSGMSGMSEKEKRELLVLPEFNTYYNSSYHRYFDSSILQYLTQQIEIKRTDG